ncbi:hypothetical protein ACQ7HM_14255 [Williamsia sp. MIQD14]|uniref:hypothetical protein n=1 Tax=Williamsia sp. MIQD14 TaxID=3425703 RepID=UPI003DA03380
MAAEIDSHDAGTWGGDEPGGVFGDGYVPVHAQNKANLVEIAQRLEQAADGVNRAADQLEEQERANSERIGG